MMWLTIWITKLLTLLSGTCSWPCNLALVICSWPCNPELVIVSWPCYHALVIGSRPCNLALVIVSWPCNHALVIGSWPCNQALVLGSWPCNQALLIGSWPCNQAGRWYQGLSRWTGIWGKGWQTQEPTKIQFITGYYLTCTHLLFVFFSIIGQ